MTMLRVFSLAPALLLLSLGSSPAAAFVRPPAGPGCKSYSRTRWSRRRRRLSQQVSQPRDIRSDNQVGPHYEPVVGASAAFWGGRAARWLNRSAGSPAAAQPAGAAHVLLLLLFPRASAGPGAQPQGGGAAGGGAGGRSDAGGSGGQAGGRVGRQVGRRTRHSITLLNGYWSLPRASSCGRPGCFPDRLPACWCAAVSLSL